MILSYFIIIIIGFLFSPLLKDSYSTFCLILQMGWNHHFLAEDHWTHKVHCLRSWALWPWMWASLQLQGLWGPRLTGRFFKPESKGRVNPGRNLEQCLCLWFFCLRSWQHLLIHGVHWIGSTIAILFCCDLWDIFIYIYIHTVFGSCCSRQECDDGPSGSGECSCMAGQEAGACKFEKRSEPHFGVSWCRCWRSSKEFEHLTPKGRLKRGNPKMCLIQVGPGCWIVVFML